jgi:hypothetical protein
MFVYGQAFTAAAERFTEERKPICKTYVLKPIVYEYAFIVMRVHIPRSPRGAGV